MPVGPVAFLKKLFWAATRPRTIERPVFIDALPQTGGAAPVFIIGCARSGTSLLRRILDSHPSIACPPESKFIVGLVDLLRCEVNTAGLNGLGFDREYVRAHTRRFISHFFETYASSKGKTRWADKTPEYIDCLDFIHEVFPDAPLVFLYRHGLDVAHSLAAERETGGGRGWAKVWELHENPFIAGAIHWREKVNKMLEFAGDFPDATLSVKYEDLTADPASQIRMICAYIGEPYVEGMLEFHRQQHDTGFEDWHVRRSVRIIKGNTGGYNQRDSDLVAQARELMKTPLAALGYQ